MLGIDSRRVAEHPCLRDMQEREKCRVSVGKRARAWRSSGSESGSGGEGAGAGGGAGSETPAPPSAACALLAPPPTARSLHKKGLRIWRAVRSASGGEAAPAPTTAQVAAAGPTSDELQPTHSLPLLQVWPSQESPRGEVDGKTFVFPPPHSARLSSVPTVTTPTDKSILNDSGIESVQASPSPGASAAGRGERARACGGGAGLLHPEHARLLRQGGVEEDPAPCPPLRLSPSSSAASSLASPRASDPCLRDDRRRSSTFTARYSVFDPLEVEAALARVARGSVGPYSLSGSVHRLTFTQTLAFPALARGLAAKRQRHQQTRPQPTPTHEPPFNTIAKVVTTVVLVLVSILVFAVVYKFVRGSQRGNLSTTFLADDLGDHEVPALST